VISLSTWAIMLGAVKLIGSGWVLGRPAEAMRALKAFPRSVWPGRVLSTVDLVWAAMLLNEMPMGSFDSWKVALYVLCPLAVVLVPIYLDELLSVRALGGLYLLLADPILDTARWHASDLSIIMSVIAYILVIFGIAFVLAPYLLGRLLQLWCRNEQACRISTIFGLIFGVAMIMLGVFVY